MNVFKKTEEELEIWTVLRSIKNDYENELKFLKAEYYLSIQPYLDQLDALKESKKE